MSTDRRQARLSVEELHQLKQLMGAALALLSFWSLASLEIGGSAILVLGGAVALCAIFQPRMVAQIPEKTWFWAGPVLLLMIGGDFLFHLPEFIPPLVRMVVLLIIYRMLAPRNQREDLQVILLCMFCVVISGVLTVSLLFAFQILMFTPLAMALLFIICLLDRGKTTEVYRIDWGSFRWFRFAGRVWRVLDFKVGALCAAMFAMVVAVSTLLFILTPRFDFDQAIPFLELSTAAKSGFNETVELGDVSEIQDDDSVAMRVDVPSLEAISSRPYWRMLVLDTYSDSVFRLSQGLKENPLRVFDEQREIRSPNIPMSERDGDLWTVYMEGAISRYLPVPGDFVAMRFQNYQDIERIPSVHVTGLDSVGQNVFSYQFEDLQFNRRFQSSESERAMFAAVAGGAFKAARINYPYTTLELDLPKDDIAVLGEINASFAASEKEEAAVYSKALTDYLWQNFSYSKSPDGAGSGDRIVSWLKTGRQGHCELFAGAFILLAREAGFPARMVVGFAGGSWNAVEDYFVIRNREAHAWVEIYDASQGNWLRVDPTPGNGSSNPEVVVPSSMIFESGWSAWVDSLRIQWYRRIVNFEQQDQVELALSLKEVATEYYNNLKERLSSVGLGIRSWIARPFDVGNLRPLLVIGIGVGVLYFGWRFRYVLLGFVYRLLRRPNALDPVRRQARRYLSKLQQKENVDEVVGNLKAIRFGPPISSREAQVVFDQARKAIRQS